MTPSTARPAAPVYWDCECRADDAGPRQHSYPYKGSIRFCPLHASAPDLKAALENLLACSTGPSHAEMGKPYGSAVMEARRVLELAGSEGRR